MTEHVQCVIMKISFRDVKHSPQDDDETIPHSVTIPFVCSDALLTN